MMNEAIEIVAEKENGACHIIRFSWSVLDGQRIQNSLFTLGKPDYPFPEWKCKMRLITY